MQLAESRFVEGGSPAYQELKELLLCLVVGLVVDGSPLAHRVETLSRHILNSRSISCDFSLPLTQTYQVTKINDSM